MFSQIDTVGQFTCLDAIIINVILMNITFNVFIDFQHKDENTTMRNPLLSIPTQTSYPSDVLLLRRTTGKSMGHLHEREGMRQK